MKITKVFKNSKHRIVSNTRIKRALALALVLVMTTSLFFIFGDNARHDQYEVGGELPSHDVVAGCCHQDSSLETLGYHGHGYKVMVYYTLDIYRGQTIADVLPQEPIQKSRDFLHWSRLPNGLPFDFNNPIMEDTTLYAIWINSFDNMSSALGGYEYDSESEADTSDNELIQEYIQADDDSYEAHIPQASYYIHDTDEHFQEQEHTTYGYADDNYYSYYNQAQPQHEYVPQHYDTDTYTHDYSYQHQYYDYNSAYVDPYVSYEYHRYAHDSGRNNNAPTLLSYTGGQEMHFQSAMHFNEHYQDINSLEGDTYAQGATSYNVQDLIYEQGPTYYYPDYTLQVQEAAYTTELMQEPLSYYHEDDNAIQHAAYTHNYSDSGYSTGYIHSYSEYETTYEYSPAPVFYYSYEAPSLYGDKVTVTFFWNYDGLLSDIHLDYGLLNFTGELDIAVDSRANVTVYPHITHTTVIDGGYVHVRLPVEIFHGDISVNMANNSWTYEISYAQELVPTGEPGEDGEVVFAPRIYTIVSITHDIKNADNYPHEIVFLQDDSQHLERGFMPFAINAPFAMLTLQPPYDTAAWITAMGGSGATDNRVIVIPYNLSSPAVVNITAGRHIIVTSQNVNLNNSTSNHTFAGTPSVVTHNGPTGRHFTVENGATLTLSHVTLDGGVVFPIASPQRGGVSLLAGGNLYMLSGSTIQHSHAFGGGGVNAQGATGTFTMSGNSRIYRNATGSAVSGGGVQITGNRTLTMNDSASISHNYAVHSGGGVALSAFGAHLIMNDSSSIAHNLAEDTLGWGISNGGGITLATNGSLLTMNNGSIHNNTSRGLNPQVGTGGGVHINGVNSYFTFINGSIHSNHTHTFGGGIFASSFSYVRTLPAGAYPQLTISATASFHSNSTGVGGFTPPANALTATNVQTIQSSGGFSHPINNLDINFFSPTSDWFRLNAAIHGTVATNIVIHPAGTTSVPDGLDGATYNLIISDPSDGGNMITTINLEGGSSTHTITVTRQVTIQAASGADIIIRMPVPGAPNTPNTAPWVTTQTTLARHFTVLAGGNLTLGGGTGTLTLDGNAHLLTQARGGIAINANTGYVTLNSGAVITNNRATTGGGVHLATNGTHLAINGGVISNNFATTAGGGVHLVIGAASTFNFSSGAIINNHSASDGGGVFASTFSYADPLPASAFPQLTVAAVAVFDGNTAGNGGFPPPANAVTATNIQQAQSSGGFTHPLNNLDINFIFGDWIRLNNVITTLPNPGFVVIHPAGSGASGLVGNTYNFVISPGNDSVIETLPIPAAPATDPRRINITSRTVTIAAAPGSNIVLDMVAEFPLNIGRHFQASTNGHLTLGGGPGYGTLTLNGNADTLPGNRGGVNVNVGTGRLTLAQGGVITNGRATSGGGVLLNSGGVGPQLIMDGGTISNNIATTNGGGVAQTTLNTHFHMNSGTITGNISTSNGGGVFLSAGNTSRFHFLGGTISNNTGAVGGAIFASDLTYASPLPTGTHFPQLVVGDAANFTGNFATTGGHMPPGNASTYTQISYASQRSGGFLHPLNNLDINFINPDADWFRINQLINDIVPAPHTIIIHPAGAPVTPGPMGAPGTYYNFVIADPGATNIISTLPVVGTSHTIQVTNGRTVTLRAASNQHITLSMNADGARHFNVTQSANLSLEGAGTGTLTLTGNWTELTTPNRGGISVSTSGILSLRSGTILRENSTASIGGGATTGTSDATINLYEGAYVINNIAGGGGGGLGLGSMHDHTSTINIFGGVIDNNVAPWGGGIWNMSGILNIYGGYITNNNAGLIGMQEPNAGALDGTIGNPHGAGGGIRVCCRGQLFMHGGVLAYNTARYGAGVLLSHGTSPDDPVPSLFVMYGGSIINNTSTLANLNPHNQRAGWVHNEDGGGIFIMSSGQFVMRDHPDGRPIEISGNTAGQSGGGVFWQVGRWDTDERTDSVTMEDNHALEDGGAIFLSYRTLGMYGEWSVGHNTANRGGGIFLHGDNSPHTYDPALGWLPHPLMGAGRLIMHDDEVRIHNNHSQTSGGGVYIYQDATFEMRAGAIDANTSEIFGGGVYVLNPGMYFTSMFIITGGEITNNKAIYGGGIYLMFRAQLNASNVLFANNSAYRMGGAIFTELIDYGYLLSGEPVPPELFPSPPDPTEILYAFENLQLSNTVEFAGNTAVAPFHSPYNAIDMLPNVRWRNWNTAQYQHVSIHIHPLNNYDINFIRPVYFYKTDMGIYEIPRTINNLEGAVFRLYRRLDQISPGVYNWEYYTSATSEINGRVALLVFTPGIFRLVEQSPPPGLYTLPPGHWYVELDFEDFELQTTGSQSLVYQLMSMVIPTAPCSCCGLDMIELPPIQPCSDNEEFFFMNIDRESYGIIGEPDTIPARLRWHVGNAPPRVALYLHKTGYEIFDMSPPPTTVSQLDGMLRAGAVFLLYRYTGDGIPASAEMPAPGWVRTYGYHVSTGNPNQPIELMRLSLREDQTFSYYQLVESVPPVGYMAPFGQWRVRMDIVDLPNNIVTMNVSNAGNSSAPEFIRLTGESGHTFAVGNRAALNLPLTGGLGAFGLPVLVTGAVMLAVGFVALAYMSLRKKRVAKNY